MPLECAEASVIHITPALQSIWVLDHSMRLFRSGNAMQASDTFVVPYPQKSATFYRNTSKRLIGKLRDALAANALMAMKLEAQCLQPPGNFAIASTS